MKRLRSYVEDADEDVGEKGVFKDWQRRDQDPERSSSHRRFYSKTDNLRKTSSLFSYDRALDDDRESSRSLRKRFNHGVVGFDRRKGFDRYRDTCDRPMQVSSSPRGLYGSDRLYRSESFSGLRREFPKGFRSERDRSRREGSSGSSWRRLTSWKEREAAADEERRSPATDSDSVGKGGSHAASPEDRGGKTKSSSGEQSGKNEIAKAEKLCRESCSSSEMEEGELEPDPEPEAEPVAESSHDTKMPVQIESENCKDGESECTSIPEKNEIEASENKKEFDGGVDGDGKEEGKATEVPMDEVNVSEAVDEVNVADQALDNQQDSFKEVEKKKREEGGGEGKDNNVDDHKVEGRLWGEEQRVLQEESISLPCQGLSMKCSDEEQVGEKEGKGAICSSCSPPRNKTEEDKGEREGVAAETEDRKIKETVRSLEVAQKGRDIDLEAEPEGVLGLFDSSEEIGGESNLGEVTLDLMKDKLKENYKDKGKRLAISISSKANSPEDGAMEGPSKRGFELVFHSDVSRPEKVQCGGVVIGKNQDDKLKMEPLDLSLSLPGASLDLPGHGRSIQSLPSSLRANSDGFTTSISFTSSQPFVHNPSCSLTQNSMDNYEHSVGSHPIVQGVDQVSNGNIWHAQASNETKQKRGAVPLFQRMLLNGNASQNSLSSLNGQHQLKPNGLSQQSSLPKELSPTHSHGSRDPRSEPSKEKALTRGRSSSSLFKSEQQEGEQLALNGSGVIENIVSKIVGEPLQLMGRMLQGMTEHSVMYLKETICEMITNVDKSGQIHAFQESLQRRSDLTIETLPKCPRILLEILVAIKTGLPDFIRRAINIPSSDFVEIFLNMKCRNLACRSMLPVDDCDCKVCVQKNGFCSACMCLVCSKFDNASNTCSWVGCDICLHWCHTECGLRDSYIRNGQSSSGALEMTEMQFHCVACDHRSEMFGFVKEVFKTCASDWKAETLAKELQYVRRIFSVSSDVRGRKLHDVAEQMLVRLEDKANYSEVINYVMTFLSESEYNVSSSPSIFLPKEPSRNNAEGSSGIAGSSKEKTWLPSIPPERVPCVETAGLLSAVDCERVDQQSRDAALQINIEKKPVVDELESVIKFKQAEAKMYQERADDARKEAESLKRIAIAKNVKIEEDYASRIAKLRLGEAEERRRQKLEEVQVIERAQREYFNMKIRMEADIKDLLLKMEATKCNFNA
ncbi:protein OBERON 4 [Elaeis guineensis]|uniref:Protein OBERON 4 n=1 Tax=Elaeis guineensis var. tenera TaxID=51953 RepID=A0A6I9QIT3_ELAGV|nr:protein OBERON 4 [Elaeis guineensis]